MSGPKSYSPPAPRYSMSMFDGRINDVFRIQSRVRLLVDELQSLEIKNENLRISIDCKSSLAKLQKTINKLLKNVVFDYKSTFGQSTYDQISRDLSEHVSALASLECDCQAIKRQFIQDQAEYMEYLQYHEFYENAVSSFRASKDRILRTIKDGKIVRNQDGTGSAIEKISAVNLDVKKIPFVLHQTPDYATARDSIIAQKIVKEQELGIFRSDLSEALLEKMPDAGKVAIKSSASDEELIEVVRKIDDLVQRCTDSKAQKKYQEELERIVNSNSSITTFSLRQFHDSILSEEKTRTVKKDLSKLLSVWTKMEVHDSLKQEEDSLRKYGAKLLSSPIVKDYELAELEQRMNQMKINNARLIEEADIRKKEHLFLKSQLILSLENLGYDVMDDLQVIDFESHEDILLKVPRQKNYLNVKFKKDGSMRYSFQIPENTDDLNTDEVKEKLHDMRVTCDDFQSVLRDLSKMGLNLKMESDKPISADSLVTLTSTSREKMKVASRKEGVAQKNFRKRYIND